MPQHQIWTEDEPCRRSLGSRAERFPKTLFALSRCRIPKAKGSGDLLSCSPVHADTRDGENYGGGTAARGGKTLTQIRLILVAANRLYILGSPRPCIVIESVIRLGNRLDLPYLINLIAKEPKKKTAKGSRAPARRRAKFRRTIHADVAHPRLLPRPVPEPEPGPARRGERARACGASFLSHTYIFERQE